MNTSTEKSKNTVILLLAIALLAAIGYCIYLRSQEPASLASGNSTGSGGSTPQLRFDNFRRPQEDDSAVDDMDRYRHKKGGKNDPNLVIYDSADIANYFTCIWPTLTQKAPPANHRWAVGFYFVRKYDPSKQDTVLDFYVTPTLVAGPIGQLTDVIDFDSACHITKYYDHDPTKFGCMVTAATEKPATGGSGGSGNCGNSYDAGQLWP